MYMGRSLHIYIEHRILKFEKHVTTSQFRYESFYYLWVKGFDIRKRDTHSSYCGFFICPPTPHVLHPPQRSPRASENKPSFPEAGLVSTRPVSSSQLTDFFKISQNPPRAFGVWRHSHSLAPRFASRAIVPSLSDTSPLLVRVNTYFNVAPK